MKSVQGHFAHLDFPAYEFREYPKWVKDPEGKKVIVHNRDEEKSVTATPVANDPAPVKESRSVPTFDVGVGEGSEEIDNDSDTKDDDPEDPQESPEDDEDSDSSPDKGGETEDARRIAARERAKARRAAKRAAAEKQAAKKKK